MRRLLLMIGFGLCCGCGAQAPDAEVTHARPSTVPAAPTAASIAPTRGARKTRETTSGPAEALTVLFAAAGAGEDRTAAIEEALVARSSHRAVEHFRIQKALVELGGAIAHTCGGAGADAQVTVLIDLETESLAAEREALALALDLAGPDVRAVLWSDEPARTALVATRLTMAQAAARASLPATAVGEASEDSALASEIRTLLAAMAGMDPTDPATPRAVAASIEPVDQALIAAQQQRVQTLSDACVTVPEAAWLRLHHDGSARDYLGIVGGETASAPTTSR